MLELVASEFNEFLEFMGQDATWRRGYACPCRNPDSGAALPNCPACRGLGFSWSDAVATSVALTGARAQQRWEQFGLFMSGDLVVTLASDQPVYAMGESDRLLLVNSSEPFTEIVQWGSSILGNVLSIDRCYRLDLSPGAGELEVELAVPVVGEDGTLSWASGGPVSGTQVSVSGRRNLEYFCLQEFPQDRAHHHGHSLPRRVVLRRWDLWGRR